MPAHLVLEDGTVLRGGAFGASRTVLGELVFNTSMMGYQEALTDPSYAGQLLMFTYPLIGNYGILPDANESDGARAWGCVCREACKEPWHPASQGTIDAFLQEQEVPAIEGIDTRALTVKVRSHGVMKAAITHEEDPDIDDLIAQVREMESPDRSNLVGTVSVDETERWGGQGPRVAVLDYGVKHSILRNLEEHFEVYRVPWDATVDDVLDLEPDGVMLSNGPGDPAHPEIMEHAVPTIQGLLGQVPMYGICLGHQILSLALGGATFKLKFGHRGANQPVKEVGSHKVIITSQNHGFAVDGESLASQNVDLTEINCNDGTLAGLALPDQRAYSVQYHPEAHPGPLDAEDFFLEFADAVAGGGA